MTSPGLVDSFRVGQAGISLLFVIMIAGRRCKERMVVAVPSLLFCWATVTPTTVEESEELSVQAQRRQEWSLALLMLGTGDIGFGW